MAQLTNWFQPLNQYCFASKPHMHTQRPSERTTIQLNEQNHKPKISRLQNRKYGYKTADIFGFDKKKPQIKLRYVTTEIIMHQQKIKSVCVTKCLNIIRFSVRKSIFFCLARTGAGGVRLSPNV